MHLVMMAATEGHCELITDFAPERAALRKPKTWASHG